MNSIILLLIYTFIILLASYSMLYITREKIKSKNKRLFSYIINIIITIILLIVTGINFLKDNTTTNNRNSITSTKATKVVSNRNDSTKENFTKEGALEAATNMLKSFAVDPSNKNKSIDDRMKNIEKDSKIDGYVTDTAKSYLYLKDFMDKSEGYTSSSMAILAIIKNLDSLGNTNLEPVSNDTQYIYFDKDTRIAQIPLDYYTGIGGAISLEMIYINEKWELSPYSLLQSIQLSNSKNNQNTTPSSSSSK